MFHRKVELGLLICLFPCPDANGGIPEVSHEASASVTADVFGGGSAVHASGSVDGFDPQLILNVTDYTHPGTTGAFANANASSSYYYAGDLLIVRVSLAASYWPSTYPGGDNPGGSADAELISVIEFAMPLDEMLWSHQLRIRDSALFEGSTLVTVEDVTQGQELLHLTSMVPFDEVQLYNGNAGDVIRITTTMAGSGNTGGPAAILQYDSSLTMSFLLPEPASFYLLLFGVGLLHPRRRFCDRKGIVPRWAF